MNLVIRNNNNIYELIGDLVKFNVHLFQNEFKNIFDKKSDITISIVNLNKIDSSGVSAIVKLNNEAISKQKQFSIIGSGNQELFNHFKDLNTSENSNKSAINLTESMFIKLYKFIENYKIKFILPRVNTIHK